MAAGPGHVAVHDVVEEAHRDPPGPFEAQREQGAVAPQPGQAPLQVVGRARALEGDVGAASARGEGVEPVEPAVVVGVEHGVGTQPPAQLHPVRVAAQHHHGGVAVQGVGHRPHPDEPHPGHQHHVAGADSGLLRRGVGAAQGAIARRGVMERHLVGQLHHHVLGGQPVAGHAEPPRGTAVRLLDAQQARGHVLGGHPVVVALIGDAQAVGGRQALGAYEALTATVALEHDDPVAFGEPRPRTGLRHRAHALVAQVLGAVVPLELVVPVDAGLVADRRHRHLHDHEAGPGRRVGLGGQGRGAGLGDGQHGVVNRHSPPA